MLKIDDLLCNEDKARDIINEYKRKLLIQICEWKESFKTPYHDIEVDKLANKLLLDFLNGTNPLKKKQGDYQKSNMINRLIRSYVFKYSQVKAATFFGVSTKTIRNRIGADKYDIDRNLQLIRDYEGQLKFSSCGKQSAELKEKILELNLAIENTVNFDFECIESLNADLKSMSLLPKDEQSIILEQKFKFMFATDEELIDMQALQNHLLNVTRHSDIVS